jgi:hypothetical protein
MRTGIIIFVNSGTEPMARTADLESLESRADYPGADETVLACSPAEVSWGWWRLVAQGLRRVECVVARYDTRRRAIVTRGEPVRLYG